MLALFSRKSLGICRANPIITVIIYAAVTTAVSSYDRSLNLSLKSPCHANNIFLITINMNYETYRGVIEQRCHNNPD